MHQRLIRVNPLLKIQKYPRESASKSRGFAIVEALIVAMLVSMAFLAASGAITSAMRLAAISRDQLVAANLAQEGVELVHRIRDQNWIASTTFTTYLAPGTYRIDYNDSGLTGSGTCPGATPLSFNASNGSYSYDGGGQATRFCRHIAISWPVPGSEIRVNSIVTWTTRGFNYSLNVESHLFNWF